MNKEELATLPTLQGTSHCSCLEHCFSLKQRSCPVAVGKLPLAASLMVQFVSSEMQTTLLTEIQGVHVIVEWELEQL